MARPSHVAVFIVGLAFAAADVQAEEAMEAKVGDHLALLEQAYAARTAPAAAEWKQRLTARESELAATLDALVAGDRGDDALRCTRRYSACRQEPERVGRAFLRVLFCAASHLVIVYVATIAGVFAVISFTARRSPRCGRFATTQFDARTVRTAPLQALATGGALSSEPWRFMSPFAMCRPSPRLANRPAAFPRE